MYICLQHTHISSLEIFMFKCLEKLPESLMLNSSPFLSPEVCWANMNTENPLMLLSEVS